MQGQGIASATTCRMNLCNFVCSCRCLACMLTLDCTFQLYECNVIWGRTFGCVVLQLTEKRANATRDDGGNGSGGDEDWAVGEATSRGSRKFVIAAVVASVAGVIGAGCVGAAIYVYCKKQVRFIFYYKIPNSNCCPVLKPSIKVFIP